MSLAFGSAEREHTTHIHKSCCLFALPSVKHLIWTAKNMSADISSAPPSPAGSLYSPFQPAGRRWEQQQQQAAQQEDPVPFSTSIYSPLRVGGKYVDAFASVVECDDDNDEDDVDRLHAEANAEIGQPGAEPEGAPRDAAAAAPPAAPSFLNKKKKQFTMGFSGFLTKITGAPDGKYEDFIVGKPASTQPLGTCKASAANVRTSAPSAAAAKQSSSASLGPHAKKGGGEGGGDAAAPPPPFGLGVLRMKEAASRASKSLKVFAKIVEDEADLIFDNVEKNFEVAAQRVRRMTVGGGARKAEGAAGAADAKRVPAADTDGAAADLPAGVTIIKAPTLQEGPATEARPACVPEVGEGDGAAGAAAQGTDADQWVEATNQIVDSVGGAVVNLSSSLTNTAVGAVSSSVQVVTSGVLEVERVVEETLVAAEENVSSTLLGLGGAVSGQIEGTLAAMGDKLEGFEKTVVTTVGERSKTVMTGASGLQKDLGAGIEAVEGALDEAVEGAVSVVSEVVGGLAGEVSEGVRGVAESVRGVFEEGSAHTEMTSDPVIAQPVLVASIVDVTDRDGPLDDSTPSPSEKVKCD